MRCSPMRDYLTSQQFKDISRDRLIQGSDWLTSRNVDKLVAYNSTEPWRRCRSYEVVRMHVLKCDSPRMEMHRT
jgi:hypothetical protein